MPQGRARFNYGTPPPDISWIRYECVCCGREQHVGLYKRMLMKLRVMKDPERKQ